MNNCTKSPLSQAYWNHSLLISIRLFNHTIPSFDRLCGEDLSLGYLIGPEIKIYLADYKSQK